LSRGEPVHPVDGTSGWYSWTGADLSHGDSGHGVGRGGAVSNTREVTDDREIRDQAQPQRTDGISEVRLIDNDHLFFWGFVDDNLENHEMDFLGEIDCLGPGWILGKRRCLHGNFITNFPLQSKECVLHDLQREFVHMPMGGGDYAEKLLNGDLDVSVRRVVID
jgi:hypothetical protein